MKKLLLSLLLLLAAPLSHAQQYVNCATSTLCANGAPSMTGTGDPAALAFSKINANAMALASLGLFSNELQLGSPNGGLLGFGTINVSGGIYVNDVIVPTYPRTSAEIAAGVTPVNYGYAPGNALRYGCVGNDSTLNDTCIANAIAAAVATGGTGFVYFPAGTYLHANTITLANNLTVYGDGDGYLGNNTVIEYTGTSDQIVLTNPINSSTAANVTIKNLQLIDVTATSGKANFVDTGSTFLYFDHVAFMRAGINLILDQSELVRITNCEFQNIQSGGAGVWIVNGAERVSGADEGYSNNILFLGNQFAGVAGALAVADDGGDTHVFIANNLNNGIRVTLEDNLTFRSNEVEGAMSPAQVDFETTKWGGDTGGVSLSADISDNSISTAAGDYAVNVASGALQALDFADNFIFSGTANTAIDGAANISASLVTTGNTQGDIGSRLADGFAGSVAVNFGLASTSSGVTCAMSAGTSCTATVPSGSGHCAAYAQGSTAYYAACSVSSTTATVTANAANSATWLVVATQ